MWIPTILISINKMIVRIRIIFGESMICIMSFIYCVAILTYFCIDAISIFKGCFNFSWFFKKTFVFRLFRFSLSTIGAAHFSLYKTIIVLNQFPYAFKFVVIQKEMNHPIEMLCVIKAYFIEPYEKQIMKVIWFHFEFRNYWNMFL